MPISTKADFIIHPELFYAGVTDVLQQMWDGFNAASGGAIRLISQPLKGDYEERSFFEVVGDLVTRRNITDTTVLTPAGSTMSVERSPKVNRKIGPVTDTLDAYRKIGEDANTMSFMLGQQYAQAVGIDYMNTALRAARGLFADVGGPATETKTAVVASDHLIDAIAKLGDRAQRIRTWVMRSEVYYALVKDQLASATLFATSDMAIMNGTPATLGRPVIVTDSPALDGSTTWLSYGLTEEAITVVESEEREVVVEVSTGRENLVATLQGEYAYNVRVKGGAFNSATINPTDAQLIAAAQWDYNLDSVKAGPGVVLINNKS